MVCLALKDLISLYLINMNTVTINSLAWSKNLVDLIIKIAESNEFLNKKRAT